MKNYFTETQNLGIYLVLDNNINGFSVLVILMRPISAHKNCNFCYLFSFQYFVWFCTYPSTALQIRLEIAGNKTHFSWLDSAISPCNVHHEERDLSVSPSSMKKKKYRQRKMNIFGLYCSFSALFYLHKTTYLVLKCESAQDI